MREKIKLSRQTVLLGILGALLLVLLFRFLPGSSGGLGEGGDAPVDFMVQKVPRLDMAVLTPVPGAPDQSGRNLSRTCKRKSLFIMSVT